MVTAHVTASRVTGTGTRSTPAKWFFRKHDEEPTTEVAIRAASGEDLYIVLAGFDMPSSSRPRCTWS